MFGVQQFWHLLSLAHKVSAQKYKKVAGFVKISIWNNLHKERFKTHLFLWSPSLNQVKSALSEPAGLVRWEKLTSFPSVHHQTTAGAAQFGSVQIQLRAWKENTSSKNNKGNSTKPCGAPENGSSSLIGFTSIWKSSGSELCAREWSPTTPISQEVTARVEFISVTASRKLPPACIWC